MALFLNKSVSQAVSASSLLYTLHVHLSTLFDWTLLFPVCYRDVKPIEHQLRPKGLGLGADRSAIKDLEPGKRQRPPKPGEERAKEEELVMGPGGCVLVESGAHKELYGKVELIRNVFAPTVIIVDMQFMWHTATGSVLFLSEQLVITFIHVLQIEGVDPDNARVMVKLAIGGKTVTVSQYAVKLIGRQEYEKYSKDLSKQLWLDEIEKVNIHGKLSGC